MQPPPNQEHPQHQGQQPPMLMQQQRNPQQWNPQQWNPQQPLFPQQQYQQTPSPHKPPNQYPPQTPPPKKSVIKMFFEIGCGLLIGYFLGFIALVLFGALVFGIIVVLDGGRTSQVMEFVFLYFVISAAISFVIGWSLSLRREVENDYIHEHGDLVEGLVIKHDLWTGAEGGSSYSLTYAYESRGVTYSRSKESICRPSAKFRTKLGYAYAVC